MIKGLTNIEVRRLTKKFGSNELAETGPSSKPLNMLLARFNNPLVIILLVAASLSAIFGDRASFFIIVVIVIMSVTLDFINSFRSQKAADALRNKVRVTVTVLREDSEQQVPASELVPGDIVRLAPGKVVPADGQIVETNGLYTNEAALTGESFPQAKPTAAEVYMGSGVISGNGLMRVTETGSRTKFSHIAASLTSRHRPTEFESEIRQFSVLILRVTIVLVSFVFIINSLFRHDFLQSTLFSLALAVGLTPELLPLIITLNLTKGSLAMGKKGVIVKQLSAIQNFGSMDVLCTDKTGTLTEDHIELVKHVDGAGAESEHVLNLGYISSHFSSSLAGPLDAAVIGKHPQLAMTDYTKHGEIPFDFERKRDSIIYKHRGESKTELITKGAPEEILKLSTSYEETGKKMTKETRAKIQTTYEKLSADGYRVLALAIRQISSKKQYSESDERELTFIGFLAFLDPAKESVGPTLVRMQKLGISIKVLTGDNLLVTQRIAKEIGLDVSEILSGEEVSKMSDSQLQEAVAKTTIFARVKPEQKMQIITALQATGHVVGFMGDGINDAPSLRAADIGISVNNAVDVAKDAADLIMLRKNLHELNEGIIEGRRTFANTMKYLRMALSSNFGNMMSMAGASLFLPFLPMLATQVLLNNLLYDTSQFAIPLDNVDEEDLAKPHLLSMKELRRFMLQFGLLSSVFDFATFGVLILVFHSTAGSFRAGWFLESIVTQILVIFIVRTKLRPFVESHPAKSLVASALLIGALATILVLSPIRRVFQFGSLHPAQVLLLSVIVGAYLLSAEILKRRFYSNRDLKDQARV